MELFGKKKYLLTRLNYDPKSISRFQLQRVAVSEDVEINPGPSTSRESQNRSTCKECKRTIARNHQSAMCDVCGLTYHIKCARVRVGQYRKYTLQNDVWNCSGCLNRECSDTPMGKIFNFSESFFHDRDDQYTNEEMYASEDWRPEIIKQRSKDSREILFWHLNVNSLQNKKEEVQLLIRQFKAQVIFLTETKIDASYSNSQFLINNFYIYRNDRVKGRRGVIAYFSAALPSKKVKLPRSYKTIEPLAVESSFGGKHVIILGLYRSPKVTEKDYYMKLEEELNSICSWISLQKQFIIIMGDLNLNRLRSDEREGKILLDMEEIHGLKCLISEPTGVTQNHSSLLDVILTNKPELFRESGVYNPEVSDQCMIYGVVKEKAVQHKNKIVQVRSYKNLGEERFKEDLCVAPWHVEVFHSLDDRYAYWDTLLRSIVNEHLPIKDIKVRDNDVPYMTKKWKNAIKAKRQFSKKYS